MGMLTMRVIRPFCRYGDEDRLSPFMGVIQAMISFFQDENDSIRCVGSNAGWLLPSGGKFDGFFIF
jgi:hypothetical protein